ncbi:hypothetical protein ACFLWW_04005, partial [Chloroflexota bacterium]
THTERYTLHTDKHLKRAIDLIDQEPEEKTGIITERIQEKPQQQPIVVIKAICKPSLADPTEIMISEYHANFVVCNEGNIPAIEIEMALLDSRRQWIDTQRETVLRADESLQFKPILHRPEGRYYILCQYKQVSSQNEDDVWAQTWLPFKLKKASKQGEVYVVPGVLEFKSNIAEKDKIEICRDKPKLG